MQVGDRSELCTHFALLDSLFDALLHRVEYNIIISVINARILFNLKHNLNVPSDSFLKGLIYRLVLPQLHSRNFTNVPIESKIFQQKIFEHSSNCYVNLKLPVRCRTESSSSSIFCDLNSSVDSTSTATSSDSVRTTGPSKKKLRSQCAFLY